ncbi:MAG: PEP-CTERM sorting domain-containing protein [Planctomycetota bacterium]
MKTRSLLWTLPAASLATCCLPASAELTLTEIARFDTFQAATAEPDGSGTNAEYVGALTSVAWDGQRLFLGGIEGTGQSSTPGIVEVLNAGSASGFTFVNGEQQAGDIDPTDVQFGSPFGQNAAGAFQGYFGLDISADGTLVGTFDFGGGGSFTGEDLKIFDVSGGAPARVDNPSTDDGARFATGPAIDPGFQGNGVSAGPAAIVFGDGGRQLYDAATGAIVTPFSSGHGVILDYDADGVPGSQGGSQTLESTLHRDLEYAANGDAYLRAANVLRYIDRTGDETADFAINLFDTNPDGFFISAQNVEYAEIAGAEDLLIFNDRPNFAARGPLDNIQFRAPDGSAKAVTVDFLDDPENEGNDLVPGNGGAYDFDYDPVTQTLVVSDFSQNQVYLFQVTDSTAGDLDGSGVLDALDVDVVSEQVGASVVNGPAAADDIDSDGVYTRDDVLSLLDVAGVLLGDVNFSGSIEQADLNAVLNNWGTTTSKYSLGDYDGSGSVEQGDLNIVLNNWGSTSAPSFEGFAVPEPATAALLGLGGLAMLRRRSA